MQVDIMGLAGLLFTAIIVMAALVVLYLIRRLKTEERLRAIEKGVPIPFEPEDPWERAFRTRRAGIVLIAVALGFVILLVVVAGVEGDKDALAGCGVAAIPLLIGLGLLYDYKVRVKRLESVKGRDVDVPSQRV